MHESQPESKAEFRFGWRTLLGATAAYSTGAPLFNYTSGFFVTSLQNAFGWSRAEVAFGFTLTMLTCAIFMPVMGYLNDRHGSVKVGCVGLGGYGLMCFILATMSGQLVAFYGTLIVVAAFYAGATAVPFAPLVAGRFKRWRGFALGTMMSGPAILLVPASPLLINLIAEMGWQAGYVALGLGALLIGIPGLLFAARHSSNAERAAKEDVASGLDFRQALRTRSYWKLVGGTLLSTLALGGFMHQYAPMLSDKGLTTTEIGLLGSIFVTMIVVGRLVVGLLLDQCSPPLIAFIVMFSAAAGALLMLQSAPSFITAALFLALIGSSYGAESDVQAFFAAREFGLASFSTIFATLMAMAAIGLGVGALLYGWLYDVSGNYDIAVYLAVVSLALAGITFGSLPRNARRAAADEPGMIEGQGAQTASAESA